MWIVNSNLFVKKPSFQLNICLFLINIGLKAEVLELLNYGAEVLPNRFPLEKIYEVYAYDCMVYFPGHPVSFGHLGENT